MENLKRSVITASAALSRRLLREQSPASRDVLLELLQDSEPTADERQPL